MKGLTEAKQKRKAALMERLRNAEDVLLQTYERFCAEEEVWSAVKKAASRYQTVLRQTSHFIERTYDWLLTYYEAQEEAWQDCALGEAFNEWTETWAIEIPDWELPDRDDGGDLEFEASTLLEELPDEAEDISPSERQALQLRAAHIRDLVRQLRRRVGQVSRIRGGFVDQRLVYTL